MPNYDSREHEAYEIARGQDATLEARILSQEKVILSHDAATAATTLNTRPLDFALALGDKLLFGLNTVVTLTGAAAAGAITLAVDALVGPLPAGEVGQKIRDLTGFTIEYELLRRRGDATPIIANAAVTVIILTQTGADRGKVQVQIPAAQTLTIPEQGSYFDTYWRTNVGSRRPVSYGTVKAIDAGQL